MSSGPRATRCAALSGCSKQNGTVVRQVGRGTFLAAANANTLSAMVTRMDAPAPPT